MRRTGGNRTGGALMLTLWCVAILSITIVTIARVVDADVEAESTVSRRFEARELALTGMALGLNPQIKPGDPLLHQKLPDGSTLDVAIASESARININRLLRRKGDPTLKNIFDLWDVPEELSSIAIDSMIDWTDKNDIRSLNGAERADLEDQEIYSLPRNRAFHSVLEMAKVRGMDAIIERRSGWAQLFSVFSSGKLDIQDVDPELLRALAGFTTSQAQALVELRNGADELPHTRDDFEIKDMSGLAPRLGLSNAQTQVLVDTFQVHGEPARVISTATVGGTRCQISAVVNRGAGGDRKFAMWEEK